MKQMKREIGVDIFKKQMMFSMGSTEMMWDGLTEEE